MIKRKSIISSGIQTFLIFVILSIEGCSLLLKQDTQNLLQQEPIRLETVQERIQQIQIALRQRKLTQARRLTEMVLLEMQWIEIMKYSQAEQRLTMLTTEAINEKKSKKFIA